MTTPPATPAVSTLPAGRYTVTVTDSSGSVVLADTVATALLAEIAANNPMPAGMSAAQWPARLATWLVAPQICPWDCDSCRN